MDDASIAAPGEQTNAVARMRWVVTKPARRIASLLFACTACGDAGPASTVVRRDSAGVRIVESMAPRWVEGEAWTVDPTPTLDLTTTGNGPTHEFYRVRHATRLRDGSLAVANHGTAEMRLFSPTGRHLRSYGRDGEGPGEFRRLTSVHQIHGDSLLAFDYWLGRLTVFDLESGGSRTFGGYDSNTRLNAIAPLSDGRIAGMGHVLEQLVSYGVYRMPHAITTFDLTGDNVDSLAVIPGFEGFQFETGDTRPLFNKNGYMAVHGDRIYLGYGDSLQIAVHRSDGALEMVMRVPGYDLRLSGAQLSAERQVATPGADMPAYLNAVFASMPDPETRPAYAALLVDANGFVWAPEYHGRIERDRPTECNIFDPDGEWLGSVRLPARFTPYEVGEDYMLGILVDDLDAERVQVLRLDRSRG